MKGVSYIADDKNRRKAVVIEISAIEKHQDETEDLLDVKKVVPLKWRNPVK